MSESGYLERLAAAAERIAAALEHLAREAAPARPLPRLKVSRSPADTSRSAPVTLKPDGQLFVNLLNVGDLETTVTGATVQLGRVAQTGQLVDRGGQWVGSLSLPPAPNGPATALVFQLERQAQALLSDEPMVLRIPHSPGRFPGTTVVEVDLEPASSADGQPSWRVVASREIPESAA